MWEPEENVRGLLSVAIHLFFLLEVFVIVVCVCACVCVFTEGTGGLGS